MSDSTSQAPLLGRRNLLGCAALVGLTGPLLVACGSDDTTDAASPSGSTTPKPSDSPTTPATNGGLVATADVPVGGGVVLAEQKIVITQPTEGEFKGFSAVCTHQGNPVGAVGDGKITCPFHGSQFAIADGANVTGPNGTEAGSVAPLPEVAIEVVDDEIVLA